MIGDGIVNAIEKIIKNCLKHSYLKYSKLKILKLVTFHLLQFMVSEIMDFKEVGISIIGVYGLAELLSNHMEVQLGHLTVSLEHKHCQYGKPYVRQSNKKTENMNLQYFYHMKNMVVSLEH